MIITTELLAKLQALADESGELEECGVLWSSGLEQAATRLTAYPGPLFKDRFRFADQWWLDTLYEAKREGLRLQAYFHTHPGKHPALLPSRADCLGHPWGSKVLILGSRELAPRLFQLYAEQPYREIPLRVIELDRSEV